MTNPGKNLLLRDSHEVPLEGHRGYFKSENHSFDLPAEHIRALDGLRALAMLLVFGCHGYWPLMKGGDIGVDLFFVLSGYLISQILFREISRVGSIDLKRFYARRFVRLFFPLLTLCLSFIAFAFLFLNFQSMEHNVIPAVTYISNYTHARFNQPDYMPHLWTLAIEEQFYLLWPISIICILRIFRSTNAMVIALVVGIASVVLWKICLYTTHGSLTRIYEGFDTHAEPIMVGCLLALASRAVLIQIGRFWPLGGLVIGGWTIFGHWDRPELYLGGHLVIAVSAATLIAASAMRPESLFARALSNPFAGLVGKWSYGGYLWHYPLRLLFQLAFGLSGPIAMLVAGPLAIAVSGVHYSVVEKRAFRWRAHLTSRETALLALAGPCLVGLGLLYAAALRFHLV